MTYAAALGLGLAIGVVMGALGGGGAILTVPVLVYVLGQNPQDATTSSLIIVGLAAAAAVVGRARAGQVRWWAASAFGVTGVVAAFAGTAVNRRIDERALLVGFAAVMVAAAVGMLLRARREAGDDAAVAPGHLRVEAQDRVRPVVGVVVAGLVVGFLTGLFGVGGGFVIVPALTLVLGLPIPVAAGTSLLIIAMNSASSLAARGTSSHVDWAVVVPFTAAAMVGTALGRRVAARLPNATLHRAFAVLLLLVAGYVTVENFLG